LKKILVLIYCLAKTLVLADNISFTKKIQTLNIWIFFSEASFSKYSFNETHLFLSLLTITSCYLINYKYSSNTFWLLRPFRPEGEISSCKMPWFLIGRPSEIAFPELCNTPFICWSFNYHLHTTSYNRFIGLYSLYAF
jgi:hypothetical protein